MKVKTKISKQLILKLAVVVSIAGAAFVLDLYFDKNPVHLVQSQNEENNHSAGSTVFTIYYAGNPASLKSFVQKTPSRFIHGHLHDKYLQKHHQLRNFHVLKSDFSKPRVPLILSTHFIIFRGTYTGSPDDPFIT